MRKINIEELEGLINYLKENKNENDFLNYDGRIDLLLNSLDVDIDYIDKYSLIENKDIDSMDLDDLKTMYTFIRRGERFCSGYIQNCIEDKTILKLAKRHLDLMKEEGY